MPGSAATAIAAMAEAVLRRLGAGDLARLTALEQAGQSHPWTPTQLAAALNDAARCVVAIEAAGGELVGHAVIARLPFEAELEAILVLPAWRRRSSRRSTGAASGCCWRSGQAIAAPSRSISGRDSPRTADGAATTRRCRRVSREICGEPAPLAVPAASEIPPHREMRSGCSLRASRTGPHRSR